MVENKVGGVELSVLPSLDSGRKLNLPPNNMADLSFQFITVGDESNPDPENIPYELPQTVNNLNLKAKGIIFQSQSNNLHHIYEPFKKYILVSR